MSTKLHLLSEKPAIVNIDVDVFVHVVKHISSVKEKLGLQHVSRLFSLCAMTPKAWSNIKEIDLSFGRFGDPKINFESIPKISLEMVIRDVFSQARNVRIIGFTWTSATTHRLVAETILQQGAHFYRHFNQLKLERNFMAKTFDGISLLISSFKSQLKVLNITRTYFSANICAQFWTLIGDCHNLRQIIFHKIDEDSRFDVTTTSQVLKMALKGKSLQSLRLDCQKITAIDLIDILRSLDGNRPLLKLSYDNLYDSPLGNFIRRIPVAQRTSLKHFEYAHMRSRIYDSSVWTDLRNLHRLLPGLEEVSLTIHEMNRIQFSENSIYSKLTILVGFFLEIMDEKTGIDSEEHFLTSP